MQIVNWSRGERLPKDDPTYRQRRLRERILEVVNRGRPLWHGNAVGWSTWFETRRSVGGWVHAAEFRAAVDDLIAAGALLELWLRPRGLEDPMHVLLIPDAASPLPRPAIRAQGQHDVIERVLGLGQPRGARHSTSNW